MPSIDLHHAEFYVTDLDARRTEFVDRFGFVLRGTVESAGARSAVLSRDAGLVVLTQAVRAEHPAAMYVQRHGDGVADIAVRTTDLSAAYDRAVRGGARPIRAPGSGGDPPTAVVSGPGDLVHTMVHRPPGAPPYLPGHGEVPVQGRVGQIDHFAMCVPAGELDDTAAFYDRVLGLQTVFTERIVVGDQAMNSVAVQNDSRTLTLTVIEPAPDARPGQIDDFLKNHGGTGIQHIALAVDDIPSEIVALRARGVEFLETPGAYYDLVADRVATDRYGLDRLRELNILVDEDADGQLFQIFARSTHPRRTFFFEIIERVKARTFGSGNIRALFEAMEHQRTEPSSREKLVRRYYELVDRGETGPVLGMFADDAVYHRPGLRPLRGRADLDWYYREGRAIRTGRHRLESVLAGDGQVAVRGEFDGVRSDGRAVSMRFADFFAFADDTTVTRRDTFFFTPPE